MAEKLKQIEVIEEGDERFLFQIHDDGTEERVPIVKEPPKKGRMSNKVAWYRDLPTGRKIFY